MERSETRAPRCQGLPRKTLKRFDQGRRMSDGKEAERPAHAGGEGQELAEELARDLRQRELHQSSWKGALRTGARH